MKIVFLQDNGINESLAVTDIAGLLKSEGYECDLFIEKSERDFTGAIRKSAPDLAVVPMDIWGERVALDIARKMKSVADVPVIFCGTYPVMFPEVIEHPEVDFVVRGESEYPILDIVRRIESGEDYADIPNVTIRRDGKIIENEMRQLIEDLGTLPPPDRSIYFKYPFMRQMSMKRFTSGRGCPNACSFCYNATLRKIFRDRGKYVRRKPVPRVIEEIETVKRLAALKSVHFSDDLFTHDRNWVLEFCEAFARNFPGMPFTCNTTVHDVDDEMLAEMKKAGCTGIAIGVETGNERLRMECLNKPYKDSDIRRTSALIKKHGMFLTAFNMMALPYETIENAFETVRLNREINADNVRVTFLSPIPRTALVENAIQDGLLKENYEEFGARVMTPELELQKREQFRTLYALVDIALISPFFEGLVRRLLPLRIPGPLFFLLMLPRMYREKKFFNIRLLSGIIFYLNTAMPQYRTKNFNNFLP